MKNFFIFLLLLSLVKAGDLPIAIVPSEHQPLMEVVDSRGRLEQLQAKGCANSRIFGTMFQNFLTRVNTTLRPHHPHIFIKPTFSSLTQEYLYSLERLPWNLENPKPNVGLFLFIHGWKGLPHDWHSYLRAVKKQNSNIFCLAPYVPQEGNCSLELAAKPILSIIQDYAKKNPGKPIVLIGTSNGGRIAMYIESVLPIEVMHSRPFALVSISGVHYGTKFIDHLASFRMLWTAKMHTDLANEFSWQSETALNCLEQWRSKQSIWREEGIKVSHLFCATTEDAQVYPLSCSLPQSPQSTTHCSYKIFMGENHLSIVPKACQEVIQWLQFNKFFN